MSNDFLTDIADTAASAFMAAGIADAAIYLPAAGGAQVACRVMLDQTMRAFGFESHVGNVMTTLQVLVAEVGVPQRGAVFVVGSDRYLVDGAPLDADEAIVMLPVKREAA